MRQKQTIPDKGGLALAASSLQIFFQRGCLFVQGAGRPPVVCSLPKKSGPSPSLRGGPALSAHRVKSRFSVESRNPNPSPTGKIKFGFLSLGRSGETRTRGLLLPKQARYQLRNTPAAGAFRQSAVGVQVSSGSKWRMTRQGLPTATQLAGIDRFTTLPAPITLFFPMVTPGSRIAPPPIHTPSSMVTGWA